MWAAGVAMQCAFSVSDQAMQTRNFVLPTRQVAARAAELRNLSLGGGSRFTPPPADREALRLVVLGEIMAGADFARERLYIECVLPSHCHLISPASPPPFPQFFKFGDLPSIGF